MHRIVVFGNSGSGKSTFAQAQSKRMGCSHMDLDTVAWDPASASPTRRALSESAAEIRAFIEAHEEWVVEGCYADLLALVTPHANELVFLNPGVNTCIANAKSRPWEPHKYSSPEAQDANLEMLVSWIKQYDQREDEFSLLAHKRMYNNFPGEKREFVSNARD